MGNESKLRDVIKILAFITFCFVIIIGSSILKEKGFQYSGTLMLILLFTNYYFLLHPFFKKK
jgi:hypothetical protein